jgi:hypothetical protein
MTESQLNELFPDAPVVAMLVDLWDVMQAWDDAEDGDEADHSAAYKKALITLPNNPIYNSCNVQFLTAQAFYDWQTANIFEREKCELHKAYMLRAGWYRIVISVVHTLYGPREAERIAPVVWRAYGEKFNNYEEEILCQTL